MQLETKRGIPRNPFINAGAIAVADRHVSLGDANAELMGMLSRLCGEPVHMDVEVAGSEAETGFRNAAMSCEQVTCGT